MQKDEYFFVLFLVGEGQISIESKKPKSQALEKPGIRVVLGL